MATSAILQWLLLITFVSSTVTALPIPDPLKKVPSLVNPWLPFKNLSDCHKGENRPGLADLKKYLNQFGYLPPPPSNSNFSDSFDSDFEDAIVSYQRHLGLNTTGYLDQNTIDKMMSPRCGVADIINGTSTHGRNLYTYFEGNPSWPNSGTLTYALIATSASTIDVETLRDVFARAFARWASAIPMNFTETDSASDADITIGFYDGSHGDGEPFDGPLGTLAHAFSPTDGRFHLDASETWFATGDITTSSSDDAIDLESVAVHEIGHLLGLGHSTVEEAIMYPTITVRTRKVELAQDDVSGVQNLYGSNPSYEGVTPVGVAGEMDSSGSEQIIIGWLGLVVASLVMASL